MRSANGFGSATKWAILTVLVVLGSTQPAGATEIVRTYASDGQYIQLATHIVYNYNATLDVATPSSVGDLNNFISFEARPWGDYGVLVTVAAKLEGSHSVSWVVKHVADSTATVTLVTYGPFLSANTDKVTLVAGESIDEFHTPGWVYVILKIDDSFQDQTTLHV